MHPELNSTLHPYSTLTTSLLNPFQPAERAEVSTWKLTKSAKFEQNSPQLRSLEALKRVEKGDECHGLVNAGGAKLYAEGYLNDCSFPKPQKLYPKRQSLLLESLIYKHSHYEFPR